MERRCKAALAAAEVCKVHLLQRRPELGFGCIGPGHPEVGFHRALEDGRIVGHQCQQAQAVGLLPFADRDAAQRDLSLRRGAGTGQDGRYGALAAAAFAHQRDKAALRDGQGHIVQDGALLLVTKSDMLQRKGAVGRVGSLFAIFRLLGREQPEDLLSRSRTIHGNVEVAAQQAQGQEEIRRQQEDGQGAGQAELALGKGRCRADDAKTRTAVGHQVHQGHAVQLHGQHLHRDLAEPLGLGIHLLVLPAVCLIDFQGGQALDILQKAVAQGGVLAPVVRQQLLGELLHRHNGQGDERHTAQQEDGRARVHAHQQHKQGHRGQQAVKQLRQILCKVGVDLLHTLAGQHHGFTGGHRLAVTGPQPGELCIDAAAQGALDILGSPVAHIGGAEGKAIAHRHSQQAEQHPLPEGIAGQAARKHTADEAGYRHHQHHIAQHPQPLEQHVQPHIAQGLPIEGKQFLVDHEAFSFSDSSGPNRRSYSPVKARSGRAEVRAKAAL